MPQPLARIFMLVYAKWSSAASTNEMRSILTNKMLCRRFHDGILVTHALAPLDISVPFHFPLLSLHFNRIYFYATSSIIPFISWKCRVTDTNNAYSYHLVNELRCFRCDGNKYRFVQSVMENRIIYSSSSSLPRRIKWVFFPRFQRGLMKTQKIWFYENGQRSATNDNNHKNR